MPKAKGLTPKQKLFVEEYLVDLNGTQAAIRAGYSPRSANPQAAENLAKPSVRRALQAAMAARAVRVGVQADDVLRELSIVGFSDVTHYGVDPKKGRLVLAKSAPFWAKRAVASVKFKTRAKRRRGCEDLEDVETDTEIKLWSKPEALKLLAQHLGIVKPPDLPPIETILASLPPVVAQQLRAILVGALSGGPAPGGGGGV